MVDPTRPQDDSLVEVLSLVGPVEMQMARDYLAEAGIPTFVFDGAAATILRIIPERLMVFGSDAERARVILRDAGLRA